MCTLQLFRVTLAALPLLLSTSLSAETKQPFSIEDLVRLKRVSEPAVSPDGKSVVFVLRETDMEANRGRQDLWLLDLQTKDAQPRRLTSHAENDNAPQWSNDGRHVYFLSSRQGTTQVWRLPIASSEAEQVTDLPIGVGSFRLSPDGARIALTLDVYPDCADLDCTRELTTRNNASQATGKIHERLFVRHWDSWSDGRISQLYVLKMKNGLAVEPISVSGSLDADVPSKPFGDASEYTFSPDSKKLVFSARLKGKSEPWSTNFDLYEVRVSGGKPRNLTEDNAAWDTQPVFSPDGTQLAWRAMERPGFEADRFHIVIADLKSGQRRPLTQAWDRSVDSLAYSADGRTLYATADDFGQHPLWGVDVRTGEPTKLTGQGRVESFTVTENAVVFSQSSLTSPAELYALKLRNSDTRALTRMNAARLHRLALGDTEQFTFTGADGATVYGYLVKPANFDPKRRYPVAFIVHGGPQVSFANQWSYRWNPQTYAGAGYASVFIDFHGSPGYGQTFTDSISGDWGGKPLEDLQKGLAAAVEKYPWLDATRMCALGASYGGYMINWMAGNWADPFKCLVNHAGILDNRFMAYSTEELWFGEWEHGGLQYEVPQNYEKHNPINHIAQWSKPMLVIHGQLDYRISYTQGIAAFTALQRRGIPSRLLIYPDENHYILKPANSIQWHGEVEKWLGEWTKGENKTSNE